MPTKILYLAGEEPPHQTDRVLRLVVARYDNVDVTQRCVCVAESDHGNVDVRRLCDGLVVGTRVCDNQQTGLTVSGLKNRSFVRLSLHGGRATKHALKA